MQKPDKLDRENQIDGILKKEYHETGIYGYWQELKPDMFEVLVQQLIPKRREQIRCILEREEKKEALEIWQDKRNKAKTRAKAYATTLRFWETNEPLQIPISIGNVKKTIEINFAYLLNNGFDWLLKTGLTVVPILSLFGIFGITNLKDPLSQGSLLVGFTVFVAITLVWLTSATIFNLIISWSTKSKQIKILENQNQQSFSSQPDEDLENKEKPSSSSQPNQNQLNHNPKEPDENKEKPSSSSQPNQNQLNNNPRGGLIGILISLLFGREKYKSNPKDQHEPDALKFKIGKRKSFELTILPRSFWMVSIIVFIVIAESVIGFAIIPGLIDASRTQAINAGIEGIKTLEFWEKFEILIGISIFSLINVLFAVAKARVYRYNTPRKMKYAKLATEWRLAEEIMKNLSAEIEKLDARINDLEKEVFPKYEMTEIKTAMLHVSNEVTLGEEYRGKHPGKFSEKYNQYKNSEKGVDHNIVPIQNPDNHKTPTTQNSTVGDDKPPTQNPHNPNPKA